MRNVELRNFGGEIYYIGGLGPDYQEIDNCHFHGSPQAAWNPGGVGKVLAKNLRAGRAWQSAEVICGRGHVYEGGRFYDTGHGGANFMSGPAPSFQHGYPYWYANWDGVGEPPYNAFQNVTFENHQFVKIGSWARGRLELVDAPLLMDAEAGRLEDVRLAIRSTANKHRFAAVGLSGPPTMTTPVNGCPPGIYQLSPRDIALQVDCLQTSSAIAAGVRHTSVVRLAGHMKSETISLIVSGNAEMLQEVGTPVEGFTAPRIQIVSNSDAEKVSRRSSDPSNRTIR